jgi:hypothetical protein
MLLRRPASTVSVKGPTDHVLDFRHQSETTKRVCDELGRDLQAFVWHQRVLRRRGNKLLL